jgi:poly-gamma-glutamate system protein
MNPHLKTRVKTIFLLSLFGLSWTSLILTGSTFSAELIPLKESKIDAATLMQKATGILKDERIRKGLPMNIKDDPNETGLIGKDYTDLTTTLGSLSSKRTSTNPNFASVLVMMLSETGVKRGGGVAISFTGSFPALNLAVLCAVHALKLTPVIISSVGASSYGANEPQWTWLDMERILRETNALPYRSEAASLGGITGTRGGLDGTGVESGMEAIRRNGILFLQEQGKKTLTEDIENRLRIYDKALNGRKPAVFINVGGTTTALGNSPEGLQLPVGLLFKVPSSTHPQRGIIFRMNEKEIPVVHLLNVKRLAETYGLPIDPIPLPPVSIH